MSALASGDYESLSEPFTVEYAWWSRHRKTHVIKIINEELFEQVLKCNIGVKFHIVALQAVMADLLSGDTIHHALNLPPSGDKSHINTMKAMLQLRWLIIDEISMVSAI